MKINSEKIQEKIQPIIGAVGSNKYIKAVSNGMIAIMVPIIIGSICVLLLYFPIPAYTDFLAAHPEITKLLNIPVYFTTNIMALLAVFFIADYLAESFGKNGRNAGLLALISFLIITPLGEVAGEAGVLNFISFDWLGSKGLFSAIIIGLLVSRLYVLIIDKKLVIKMPDGVPPAVSNSFSTLVPGAIVVALSVVVTALFNATPFGSLNQLIYSGIQAPLSGLGTSFIALEIVIFCTGFLWLFGINGSAIILQAIMYPIYMTLDMQNLAAFQAGGQPENIVGNIFVTTYVALTGTGCTIGLVIHMLRAKSKQFRTLGKLALPTSIFMINEPVIFGTPIVLNLLMAIPFIFTPMIAAAIAYFATAVGIVPVLPCVIIPWTTPPIISGMLNGGWRVALLQAAIMALSYATYYIPFKILDAKTYELERKEELSS